MRFAWLGWSSILACSLAPLAACGGDDDKKAAPSAEAAGAAGDAATPAEGGSGGASPSSTGGAAGELAEAEGGAPATMIIDGCAAPSGDGTDVPNTIDADETWTVAGSPYRISGTLYLTGTLTLEPCVVVQLDEDAAILVGNDPAPGAIVAHGTSTPSAGGSVEKRIRFERLVSDAPWNSLSVDTTGQLDFEYVTLDGGGSTSGGDGAIVAYGVDPQGDATASLRLVQTTVSGSATYGINLRGRAAFSDDSSGVSVVDSGGDAAPYPIYVEAGAAFSLPSPLTLSGNAVDEVLVHPFAPVFEDTFPARGVPLRVDGAIYLQDDVGKTGIATLTLEPGLDLRFEGQSSCVYVGGDSERLGRIVAEGTAAAPIKLRSAKNPAEPGDWLGLYYRYPSPTGQVLSYVTIADAGAPSGAQGFGCGPIENNASLLLLTDLPVEPFLDHCTIENAGGDTQMLLGWSDDTDAKATAQSFFATTTFAASPDCRVSFPRDTSNACPGNDTDQDCL